MVQRYVWKRESSLLTATMKVEKWFGHKIPSVGNWLSHEKGISSHKLAKGHGPRSMQHSNFWKVSLRQGANFHLMVAKSGRGIVAMICVVLSLKCQLFQQHSGANVIGRWFRGEWIINVSWIPLRKGNSFIGEKAYILLYYLYCHECHPVIKPGLSVKDVTNSTVLTFHMVYFYSYIHWKAHMRTAHMRSSYFPFIKERLKKGQSK